MNGLRSAALSLLARVLENRGSPFPSDGDLCPSGFGVHLQTPWEAQARPELRGLLRHFSMCFVAGRYEPV